MVTTAAEAVYYGKYGGQMNTNYMWLRDDRIGSMETAGIGAGSAEPIAPREKAVSLWVEVNQTYYNGVLPYLMDFQQQDMLGATVEYGLRLYTVIEAGWKVMVWGYLKLHGHEFNATALNQTIADYYSHFGAYKAFGLANRYAASLYHDYYLCLGTFCTGAFDPSDTHSAPPGIGSSIRKIQAFS